MRQYAVLNTFASMDVFVLYWDTPLPAATTEPHMEFTCLCHARFVSQLCTLWSHLSRLVFIVLTVSIVSQEPSSLDDKARKTAVPVDLDSPEPAVPASQGVSIHRMALRRLLPGVYYI